MPQKNKPVRLEELAVKGVGEWVKFVGRGLIQPVYIAMAQDPSHGQIFLQSLLDLVQETLCTSVPWNMFDKMAEQILSCVNELIDETKDDYDNSKPMIKFVNSMKVVAALTQVVMHQNLKHLNVSVWPKIMRHVLNQNLYKLEGLEHLNLGSGSAGWDTSGTEKYILSGVMSMKNLRSFCLTLDCTNAIINVIGKNCLLLEKLDITASKSVNDNCLPSLFNCKSLKEVNLYRTSVTCTGYRDLLLALPNIQDLGRCDCFGSVLENLRELKSNPISLTTLECKDISIEQMNLLISFCPNLTSISLFHDNIISDLTILKELKNLKCLKLSYCEFFTDYVDKLLRFGGQNLDTLHLENVEEMDINALVYISMFCPKLKTLRLLNCEFSEHAAMIFDLRRLAFSPFACLENLVCRSECTLDHLLFLMQHSINIKYILLSSSPVINDTTISLVLERNPMKWLEELTISYTNELSMSSVMMLLDHCPRLHRLSGLESWEEITDYELREFREFIQFNNIKLDTTHNFPY